MLDCGEFAGEDEAQLGAHFFAQASVALGLGGLALQRIHLARDFVENVVDAGQVQLGVFEAGFGQALFGLEFRDSGGFFEDGAAVGGAAAEDLADASLLDQRVGLRAQAGAHEEFLNVAQAAELAIQQVFAVAGAEQAARDVDLTVVKLLLVELTAADFENHVGRRSSRGGCGRRREHGVGGEGEHGFIVGKCDRDGVDLRARDLDFFSLAGLGIFDRLLGVFGGACADGRFVPVVGNVASAWASGRSS